MKVLRSYKLRGSPDCPIALYYIGPHRKKYFTLRRQPELEFIILHEGELDYHLDGDVLHMSAGDVLVIAPEQSCGLVSHTPNVKYYRLIASTNAIAMPAEHIFQKEFVQPLQNGLLQLPSLLQPNHPAYESVAEALSKLPNCMMSAPNYKLYRYRMLVSLCIAISPWCIHLDGRIKDTLPSNMAVRQAMLYIHNHYQASLDLQTIATYVHLHPNYLCALFKEHTGQTVMQYLIRKRVDAAIFLLQDSILPIEEIAEKSGFGNRCVFFRHFRRITGTTPHAYRKHQLHAQE